MNIGAVVDPQLELPNIIPCDFPKLKFKGLTKCNKVRFRVESFYVIPLSFP